MSKEINLSELLEQTGLPELGAISEKEIAMDFMPAAVVGLADGDIMLIHPPYTGQQAELYGEHLYGEGRVARAIVRAAIENGMAPGPLYDFQSFAAQYFTEPHNPLGEQRFESVVRVFRDAVTVDGNAIELASPPRLVFDYGACLTGRSYIADQVRFFNQGMRPFTYGALTRLHFTNQALINTYNTDYGPGTSDAFISRQLYLGREDGVAAATDEVIRAQREHGAPAEVADLILATGAQHVEPKDLKRGIVNAHTLLKEGGRLIVRSFARPASDELGTDEIVGWAFNAGFAERDAVHLEAAQGQVGALLLGGHLGGREMKTVVLTKGPAISE